MKSPLQPAVAGPPEARNPLRVMRELGQVLGHEFSWETAEDVRRELASTVGAFGVLAGGVGPEGVSLDAAPNATVQDEGGAA